MKRSRKKKLSKTTKFVPEGGSSNRPSYFDGTDYYY